MKYLLLVLLFLPMVYAQTTFFKETFSPGETVQLEIKTGLEIIGDLSTNQIEVLNPIGEIFRVSVNLIKIENDHYFAFFDLPIGSVEGTYNFKIKNIRYRDRGNVRFAEIAKNFDIADNNYNIIRLFPGAAVFREGENSFLKFRVSNLEERAVTLRFSDTGIFSPSVSLLQIPGRFAKTFYLLVNQRNISNSGLEIYGLENYVIPIYIKKSLCVADWRCNEWGSCADGKQRRDCVDLNNCNITCNSDLCLEERSCECIPRWECVGYGECVSGKRECDAVADVNACGLNYRGDYSEFLPIGCDSCVADWRCNEWGSCADGKQRRDCVDLNNCNITCNSDLCLEEKSCECVPRWECRSYGECIGNNRKCNAVSDINNCGLSYGGSYSEFAAIGCNICIADWRCNEWGSCADGHQVRDCVDLNNCNITCNSDLCNGEKSCRVSVDDAERKYSVVFFRDIENPNVIINSIINPDLNEKNDLSGVLYIKNNGENAISNIRFGLTGNLENIVRINTTMVRGLNSGEVIGQLIYVNERKNPRQDEYRGDMLFISDQLNKSFPMLFVINREPMRAENVDESPEGRRYLFREEVEELTQEEIEFPFSEIEKEEITETGTIKELPYKTIVFVLVVVLIIVVYFIFKKSTRRKLSFGEYLSNIEKK